MFLLNILYLLLNIVFVSVIIGGVIWLVFIFVTVKDFWIRVKCAFVVCYAILAIPNIVELILRSINKI